MPLTYVEVKKITKLHLGPNQRQGAKSRKEKKTFGLSIKKKKEERAKPIKGPQGRTQIHELANFGPHKTKERKSPA